MPLPLICARSSSSSMNWPAFSMVRIIVPELYLFGGEVSPSLISSRFSASFVPFFSRCTMAIKSGSFVSDEGSSVCFPPSPFSSAEPSFALFASFFLAKEYSAAFKYPS